MGVELEGGAGAGTDIILKIVLPIAGVCFLLLVVASGVRMTCASKPVDVRIKGGGEGEGGGEGGVKRGGDATSADGGHVHL